MSIANVGSTDRIIRILGGIILIAAPLVTSFGLWENQTARILAIVIGAILVLTGLLRFCGLYKILGIRTNG